MRQNKRRFHYIYKTTCTETGKYYLGMHSTDNLNDGYMGSGKILLRSIAKYGQESHVCEILEHYFTREWLREREAELVCAETLTDPQCMNLKLGGEGGWDAINASDNRGFGGRKHTNEIKLKIAQSSIGRECSLDTRLKISANNTKTNTSRGKKVSTALTGRKLSDEHKANIAKSRQGRKMSPETKKKISDARRARA